MARRGSSALGVHVNGRTMGTLRQASSGAIDFTYDPAWLDWPHAHPLSLSLPMREDRYVGAPVEAVLDNLLPDDEGIRNRMAARVRAEGSDVYSLLAAIGRDCVGALQFLPEGEAPERPGEPEGEPLSDDDVASLLDDLATTPLGLDNDADFRISVAGVQEKTALLRWRDRWWKPHGSTPTTHILKPPIDRGARTSIVPDSVENEYLCLRFATALGIASADATIVHLGEMPVLAVKRFDRRWTDDGRLVRLPQEDMCQALGVPPVRKYEADGGPGLPSLLDLVKGSDAPEEDRVTLLKTQFVFWLLGATDGHAKNISVFLYPGGRFRLTPAYDILSAQPLVDARQIARNQMKLAMAAGEKRYYPVGKVMPRHFRQTAERTGVNAAAVDDFLHDIAMSAPSALEQVTHDLPQGFPEQLVDSILGGVRARLRLM